MIGTGRRISCFFLSWVPGDFHFHTKLQMIEGMRAFAFGARAHQELSDGEMMGHSQSMGGVGIQPKIPQERFFEPNNHQTSAGPFPECRHSWESGGKCHGVLEKLCDEAPLGASSTLRSLTSWRQGWQAAQERQEGHTAGGRHTLLREGRDSPLQGTHTRIALRTYVR